MQRKWIRGALVGGLAFLLENVVSNMLFFQLGAPLLFDNPAQSKKAPGGVVRASCPVQHVW